MLDSASAAIAATTAAGVARGDLVGVAVVQDAVGLATSHGWTDVVVDARPVAVVEAIETQLRPRWVVWSNVTAAALVAAGVRIATCWDVAAVHRLLVGGWRAEPGRIWAHVAGLATESMPAPAGELDLFSATEPDHGDPDDPIRTDGHLRPDWVEGGWQASPRRVARWAALAAVIADRQQAMLAALTDRPMAVATARSESAAELLCAELAADGLPMDRAIAETIIAGFVGLRPRHDGDAEAQRRARDRAVLDAAGVGSGFDLRSPGQVRSLLRRVGIEVPDTRAWRLEAMRDAHPVVEALLGWRKAERIASTFGYAWLDEHLGPDGRLRGDWTGSDGAAGRMTATAGLHNMPAEMRPAVVAEADHVFVRADLGQIEPRVLAAVSGDADLARATADDDMYAPVATRLNVDRATAKVAVLGAMYGQTTGHGAQALRGLEAAYPTAMAYLDAADRAGQTSRELRTYGGRLIRMGTTNVNEVGERDARSAAAARGRYGRNAMIQGAAAELFKVWAATVRARGQAIGARIVLCLHDELLVHVAAAESHRCARLVGDCLQEAAHRWAPDDRVRFVADVSVVERWSDATSADARPTEPRS
jgi:DNA polymerase-1